jgi:sugar phosphate permease
MSASDRKVNGQAGGVRFLILGMVGLAAIHSYFVRVGMAPTSAVIQSDLNINDIKMGSILGAFYLGYFISQIPGGWLGTRLGARIALPILALVWSGSNWWAANSHTSNELYYARILTGLAQGGLFPIVARVIRDWFPIDRRASASSIPNACMSIGAVAATAGIARMMEFGMDWRQSFMAIASFGVIWAIAFLLIFRDNPADHPWVSSEELRRIESGRPETERMTDTAIQKASFRDRLRNAMPIAAALAASVSFWALCLQSIFRAFGHAFFFTWYPKYLSQSRGMSINKASELASFPLASVILGSLAGGVIADKILRRTGSLRASRSYLTVITLLAAGLSFPLADLIGGPPWISVGVITIGTFLFGFSSTSTWAATIDMGKERTPIVFAIMNMTGNIGAWACPVILGYMFESIKAGKYGWGAVGWLFLANFIAAGACWAFLDPGRPIESNPVDSPEESA